MLWERLSGGGQRRKCWVSASVGPLLACPLFVLSDTAPPVMRLVVLVKDVSWRACFGTAASEVKVLRSLEFIHQGRRCHGRVAPMPGGGPEFIDGAWFVSMNGRLERRVFEAHQEGADTPDFRDRMMVATWRTEEYNRRGSGERRQQGTRDSSVRDRRGGPQENINGSG